MPATVGNFLIIKRAHALIGNGNYGLMTSLISLGQVKPNLLRMFDAQSFDNIEGSLTKSLKIKMENFVRLKD